MNLNVSDLETELNKSSGLKIKIDSITNIRGGDICQAYKVQCASNAYFLKTHQPTMYSMLESEVFNLQALASANCITVPKPIASGQTDGFSYLLIEFLQLTTSGSHEQLGISLANLHQQTNDSYGWKQNNYIGATVQPNSENHDWIDFWRYSRLGYQLDLAKQNSAPKSLISNCERLLNDFAVLFTDYSPSASLLHGDLWSGNYSFLADGLPVLYDPACYYGDREADIAMTELFGGFKQEFYHAYQDHLALDNGYQVRKDFYNLYHILNHFNLFGGGYANQAEQLCISALSQLKS